MTEWINITQEKPPFDTEVLCKHKDFPNYWVGERCRVRKNEKEFTNEEYFKPTICTCCNMEMHGFETTHWRFIDP